MLIEKLPYHLIDQIAAGEVVGGPSSAIKELLENSLDAGSTHITLHIENAGYDLIRLTDNGCGIEKNQLRWAFERHATSKLKGKNLFDIHTLGFRGEALASIASVAEMVIESRTAESDVAYALKGQEETPTPLKGAIGTTVRVEKLFQKIPARLKFARSIKAERTAIRSLLSAYALAYPSVKFEVWDTGKPLWRHEHPPQESYEKEVPATQNFQEGLLRRLALFFPDIPESAFFNIDAFEQGYHVKGFIASPHHHYTNKNHQYFFVKGRPLKDKLLSLCLHLAYQDVIVAGRFPLVVLFLDLPSVKIDVNVHPAKEEVRFAEPHFLKTWLIHLLKKELHKPLGKRSPPVSLKENEPICVNASFVAQKSDSPDLTQKREPQSLVHTQKEASHRPATTLCENAHAFKEWIKPQAKHCLDQRHFAKAQEDHRAVNFAVKEEAAHPCNQLKDQEAHQNEVYAEPKLLELDCHPLGRVIGNLHKRYILAENKEGLVLVDQHAAHERFNYEKLKNMLHKSYPAQALATPLPLSLPPHIPLPTPEHITLFKRYGLQLAPQGGRLLMIYELPTFLKVAAAPSFVKNILEAIHSTSDDKTLNEERHSEESASAHLSQAHPHAKKHPDGFDDTSEDALKRANGCNTKDNVEKKSNKENALQQAGAHIPESSFNYAESVLVREVYKILGNVACKNSLKSGDALTFPEMNQLLRDIEQTEAAAHCNHGRPTYVILSRQKIDTLFERS